MNRFIDGSEVMIRRVQVAHDQDRATSVDCDVRFSSLVVAF